MATLAESATGMVFGIHVPDTHIPLIKRLTVRYHKLARGDLTAVATISEEQIRQIQTQERGSVVVPVTVTDQDDTEPIAVEMEWAWTTKNSKNKS
jgi:acyl-coenzyme A thioesterase PaaI-like protein